MDDLQRAREPESSCLQELLQHMRKRGWIGADIESLILTHAAMDAAALRAAPDGWSLQRQDDGSIIVTAEGYGVVHVRPDDSDSIAAAMLHMLANDLAARPEGVKDGK